MFKSGLETEILLVLPKWNSFFYYRLGTTPLALGLTLCREGTVVGELPCDPHR